MGERSWMPCHIVTALGEVTCYDENVTLKEILARQQAYFEKGGRESFTVIRPEDPDHG